MESFCQRVKVNIFYGYFKRSIPVVAAASLGLTGTNPVGSLVADALKAVMLHKGFQEIDGMTVFILPVSADAPGNPA